MLLSIVLDQWTKDYMWQKVFVGDIRSVEIFSWLNWYYARNSGMAWSLFQEHPSILLLITSVISLALIIYALHSSQNGKVLFAWALVAGGALGNIWDRLHSADTSVRDFIQIHWKEVYYWPTFNLADSFICVGAIYLFLYAFIEESRNHA
jgi:signal peptidase II